MANSKFKITFLAMPTVNTQLHIGETNLGLDLLETFKVNRLGVKQVKIPNQIDIGTVELPQLVYSGFLSQFYKTAFNVDYNATALFTVTALNGAFGDGLGSIEIEANYSGAVFVDNNTHPEFFQIDITNEAPSTAITIDSIDFLQAPTEPCNKVKVSIATSGLAVKYSYDGVVVNPNVSNPIVFDLIRGQLINVTVENADGNQDTQLIQLPVALVASNFSITYNNSPYGASATVNSSNTNGLVLQYSLDNATWQTSNIFAGLTASDYTLYVRDQLGCSFNIPFTIGDNAINVPYFYMSKSNSIRMAQRVVWGDAANYKTDENTLSCEMNVDIPYHEVQLFQTSDVITTQFKSNYGIRTAKVIKEDNTVIAIPIIQKSNNIGLKAKIDAQKFSVSTSEVGIYFLTGNTYDYGTNVINGSHSYNGTLPEWAIVGNYINIGVNYYLIERTYYDEVKNADVIVISDNYVGPEVAVITGCIYNIFDYEVYEFSIDMAPFIGTNIKVRLINSDTGFGTIEYLSEDIYINIRQENTLDIHYWNDDNNDVFYASGIKHRLRIPYTRIEGISDEDVDTLKSDTNTSVLSADVYEGDKFIFEPITKEMWRKLIMALSHKNVFVDGVRYAKTSKTEVEGPIDESNLYVLTISMLKSGTAYTSNGATFTDQSIGQVPIPGLLDGNDGFVAY